MNGELIYKRWLNTGQSKVFDIRAYDKYTHSSCTDLDIKDSKFLIYLKAKVRFFTTKEGGRLNGIKNGYRPNIVLIYTQDSPLSKALEEKYNLFNKKNRL